MEKIKVIKLLFIFMVAFFIVGCSDDKKKDSTAEFSSNQEDITDSSNNRIETDTENMKKLSCTRDADAGAGIDVNLSYEVYYQGEYIQILYSKEQVISDDQDVLDEYENAYRSIDKNYEGLKYYDISIVRTEDSVTDETVINYGKIDIDKLLEIEGEEDNVIKDGKVKLDDWLEFTEPFGMKCE